MAGTLGNLAGLYHNRDFDRAEEMYLKSLVILESLGHKLSMARQLENLGILYKNHGNIGEQRAVAGLYSNLGLLYGDRKEFDRAEEMYQKSLVLFETLDNKIGVAQRVDVIAIVETLVQSFDEKLVDAREREEALQNRIRELTEAVTALASKAGQPDAPRGVEEAQLATSCSAHQPSGCARFWGRPEIAWFNLASTDFA